MFVSDVIESSSRQAIRQVPRSLWVRDTRTDACFRCFEDIREARRFKALLRAFDYELVERGYVAYVMHLTFDEKHRRLGSAALNPLLSNLKRRLRMAGMSHVPYRWVPELHKRRSILGGEAVMHHHLVIGCPSGFLPDVRSVWSGQFRSDGVKVKRLEVKRDGDVVQVVDLLGMWGKGRIQCELVHGSANAYLSKYLTKELFSRPFGPHVRAFGSSRVPYDLSWPVWARDIRGECEEHDLLGYGFRWQLSGSTLRLYERVKVGRFCGYESERWSMLLKFRSPYRAEWHYEDGRIEAVMSEDCRVR